MAFTMHMHGRRVGRVTTVRLSGVLDASLPHDEILGWDNDSMVFDLAEVERITSYGVLSWTKLLRDLTAPYIGIINCHPPIVAQFNMVRDFAGRAELLTLFAPYACDACDETHEVLIDVSSQFSAIEREQLPNVQCPHCQEECELDDIPSIFLSYARRAGRPSPPAEIVSILGAAAGAGFCVNKEIRGELAVIRLVGNLTDRRSLKHVAHGLVGEILLIASELTNINSRGVEALAAFLRTPGVSTRISEWPQELWQSLATAQHATGARVLSMRRQSTCPQCGEQTLVVHTEAELRYAMSGGSGDACSHCGGPLAAALAPDLAANFDQLQWAAPTGAISEYLDTAEFLAPDSPERTKLTLGKYEILRELGVGGMGTVHLARHNGPHGFTKDVVVKQLRVDGPPDQEAANQRQFLEEARISARLAHPNILQVFDFGIEDGKYALVMEYVCGGDLGAFLSSVKWLDGKCPIDITCRIISDIASALAFAHAYRDDSGNLMGVVHRDVTPSNILVGVNGSVKLSDFGISKGIGNSHGTPSDILKGKPAYLAPELWRGEQADGRSDVFALATTLYECLALEHAYTGPNPAALMANILEQPPPDVRVARPEAPEQLARLIQNTLVDRPSRPTADEFHCELEAIIAILPRHVTSADVAQWATALIAEVSLRMDQPRSVDVLGSQKSEFAHRGEKTRPSKKPLPAGPID